MTCDSMILAKKTSNFRELAKVYRNRFQRAGEKKDLALSSGTFASVIAITLEFYISF